MGSIKYLKDHEIQNKRVLLRVDYNVSLDQHHKISDATRITQSLPTIKHLLPNNKIIIISHLDRPKTRDEKFSLKPVVELLKKDLPDVKISLVDDFESSNKEIFEQQKNGEILVLENIRFYKGEEKNDPVFAKELALLADIYVNDSFGVDHRAAASTVGIPKFLPSFAGLLLEKEINVINGAIEHPKKPFVAIMGGAKVSDKIKLINKLISIADYLLLGGGIANPFLKAAGANIGKSMCEDGMVTVAHKLIEHAKREKTQLILPSDVRTNESLESKIQSRTYKINEIPNNVAIYDIGSATEAEFGSIIAKAKTIIWNGPVGVFENPEYRSGTDFIYYSIVNNTDATSILGGGDTLAAITNEEYKEKITHISTGGGAMLELIEKGTLPGIEALKQSNN